MKQTKINGKAAQAAASALDQVAPLDVETAKKLIHQDLHILHGFLDFIKSDSVVMQRLADNMIRLDEKLRKEKSIVNQGKEATLAS